MYTKELEELIDSILADGVITDGERKVLRKRAEACGEDPDEVIIVAEGRLAKMKGSAIPAKEKRGNLVHCPNCGALVEAGSGKCKECGHVFTNVKANSTAREFAKELDEKLSRVRGDKGKEALIEFIKNYPIPSGKEDLMEFISSMDARRRSESDYQLAYKAKYNECVSKARILFAGDPQVEALLEQTGKFGISTFSKEQKKYGIYSLIGLFVLIVGGVMWMSSNKASEKAAMMAEAQCDSLCLLLDALDAPDINNYKDIENKLLKITWKDIPGDETEFKSSYLNKKRNLAEQIGAVEVVTDKEYKEYKYNGAPDPIHWPDLDIDN